MWAGCYTLDLYCDAENPAHRFGEFPHQYTGETGTGCRARARRAGWTLGSPDGRAQTLCPKCSGKRAAQKVKDAD
jgi:hypothetical protein